jgi:hypothetical protein
MRRLREVKARAILFMATYHWRLGWAVRDRWALGGRHGAAKEGTTQSECKELGLVRFWILMKLQTVLHIVYRRGSYI